MAGTTPRWSLRYPGLLDAPLATPTFIQNLALDLDDVGKDLSGTFAARPAASKRGIYYWATDTRVLYRDNGSTWDEVKPKTIVARAEGNANVSVPHATWTAVALAAERFDTDVIHDNSTNNHRLTCKTAGLYLITGHFIFTPAAGGQHRLGRIRYVPISTGIARTVADSGQTTLASFAGRSPRVCVDVILQLSVNDYVQMEAYQDSGGAVNVEQQERYSPELMMVKVA